MPSRGYALEVAPLYGIYWVHKVKDLGEVHAKSAQVKARCAEELCIDVTNL